MKKMERLAKKIEMSAITEQILTSEAVRTVLGVSFGASLLDVNTLLDELEYLTNKQAYKYAYLNNHQFYIDNCTYQTGYVGYSKGLFSMELKLYSNLTYKEKLLRIMQSL